MILEAVVTTIGSDGRWNIAPMGPLLPDEPDWRHFQLRPYQTSVTYRNLRHHGEGVLHVTDDVWLIAQAAVGAVDPPPRTVAATAVRGLVLADACRWHEFRVRRLDDSEPRTVIDCDVVHTGRHRDFFGFNRAKHAVIEAAILATRTEFLPIEQIRIEFERLAVMVQKTGGAAETRAFAFLREYVDRVADRADR